MAEVGSAGCVVSGLAPYMWFGEIIEPALVAGCTLSFFLTIQDQCAKAIEDEIDERKFGAFALGPLCWAARYVNIKGDLWLFLVLMLALLASLFVFCVSAERL